MHFCLLGNIENVRTRYAGIQRGKSLAKNRLDLGTHLLTFAGKWPPGDIGAALKKAPPYPKYGLDFEC
jgi:hypothetical protein